MCHVHSYGVYGNVFAHRFRVRLRSAGLDQGNHAGPGHLDIDDGGDGVVLLDVLEQSQQVVNRQYRRYVWGGEHWDHFDRRRRGERSLRHASGGFRSNPEELFDARRCRGGLLVHNRLVAPLLHLGSVHRAHRVLCHRSKVAEGKRQHGSSLSVGVCFYSHALRHLPGSGKAGSVFLHLPRSGSPFDAWRRLPDLPRQTARQVAGNASGLVVFAPPKLRFGGAFFFLPILPKNIDK
jgi:hypothetical protein